MKVLHVIPSLSLSQGGPSKAIRVIESALRVAGVTVHIASTDDDGPGLHNTLPCSVFFENEGGQRIQFKKSFDFYKVSPAFAWWVMRHANEYDLMHIHALFSFTSIVAAWAARWHGVPYIVRPLGTLNRYGVTSRRPWLKRLSIWMLERRILRHAAAVHFTSQAELDEAIELNGSMNGVVFPLGIETFVHLDSTLFRDRFPSIGGGRYLLYLSRLDPKKNVEGLFHAFHQGAANWSDLKLVVAGDGAPHYVAGLKALVLELGLHDIVVWTGHLDGDLKASAMAGAELFVLPSFSENFGIAAAEALMAGLPCVLAEGVAIAKDVVNSGAGVAVAPDPASIAAGLTQVISDPQLRDEMSVRAHHLARDMYSAEAMGANLIALYENILVLRHPLPSKMETAKR